eukprot:g18993.t2
MHTFPARRHSASKPRREKRGESANMPMGGFHFSLALESTGAGRVRQGDLHLHELKIGTLPFYTGFVFIFALDVQLRVPPSLSVLGRGAPEQRQAFGRGAVRIGCSSTPATCASGGGWVASGDVESPSKFESFLSLVSFSPSRAAVQVSNKATPLELIGSAAASIGSWRLVGSRAWRCSSFMGPVEKERPLSGQRGGGGAMVAMPSPDRNALNGMGEFILTQVRRGASEQQWSDWLKVPFEHACLAHDMSTIRRLLEAGVNGPYDRPRDPRYRRHTLLHLSSACGNTEVVNTLLRWGSAPDVACREPGEKAYTPLHRAALGGHGEAARVLIKAGADKDAKTGGSGATPLHLAARKGHENCVRTLLLTGADKNSRRGLDGATPLHQAAFFGQMGAVRELLESTANPNIQDAEGCTPVFLAAQEGHEEVVVDLLRNGASPDLSREDGWAPLHAAARFGHAATASALLTEGRADFEAITADHGSTALHVAAISGFDEVLTVLLDVGSDLESADAGGWTPLHCACAAARASCVNALITRGADPTAMTPEGQRPASLIGTDLAEGEESNEETNETIRKMLRVPRADSESRRRRHKAKHAGNQRPPPPYNDRPPPAYGPDVHGGVVVFDSAGSSSATGSASGSFSGSGSRQLHRSPTHPQTTPTSGGKEQQRGGRSPDGHPRPHGNTNGGAPHGASRSPTYDQRQQPRRPRSRERTANNIDPSSMAAEAAAADVEAADAVAGLGGYNPKTEPPSSRDKRFSTGGVVAGHAARPVSSAKAALAGSGGGSRGGGGGAGGGSERQGSLRNGERGGRSAGARGGAGAATTGSSSSLSPPRLQGEVDAGVTYPPKKGRSPSPQKGAVAAAGGGNAGRGAASMGSTCIGAGGAGAAVSFAKDADSDVVMDLGEDDHGNGGEEMPRILRRPNAHRGGGGGGGISPGKRVGDLLERPWIQGDGRRSSAGRASGGFNNLNSNGDGDGDAGNDLSKGYGGGDAGDGAPQHSPRDGNAGGTFSERSGGGGGVRMGAAEGLVANRIAAFDPFSYSKMDAHSAALADEQSCLKLFAQQRCLLSGQSVKRCEGDMGTPDWVCDPLTPVPLDAFGEFYPLPGAQDPANPVKFVQIAGTSSFDVVTGERNNGTGSDAAAMYVLTDGCYFCMLAESDHEAVLFDAPESAFTSSFDGKFPNGTLKYIVYTHRHWDHMGAAGLVADHFAADSPVVIASRRTRLAVKKRNARDPTTVYGNNRGVPVPEWYEEDVLEVGGLRFTIEKAHAHQAGDLMVTLDKNDPENAGRGIDSTIFMVTDTVFPGCKGFGLLWDVFSARSTVVCRWRAPFYLVNIAQDIGDFFEALDEINGKDFDVLVGGHLSRLGNKADVQRAVDFFVDLVAGSEAGVAVVTIPDIVAGTGVADPANPNFGNTWLMFNEFFERLTDVCVEYVLDAPARGRDWLVELAGMVLTLRSQCWSVMNWVGIA